MLRQRLWNMKGKSYQYKGQFQRKYYRNNTYVATETHTNAHTYIHMNLKQICWNTSPQFRHHRPSIVSNLKHDEMVKPIVFTLIGFRCQSQVAYWPATITNHGMALIYGNLCNLRTFFYQNIHSPEIVKFVPRLPSRRMNHLRNRVGHK